MTTDQTHLKIQSPKTPPKMDCSDAKLQGYPYPKVGCPDKKVGCPDQIVSCPDQKVSCLRNGLYTQLCHPY